MTRVHLLCNAHVDPAWLWEWEEGAAEAISTFRTAADFCEQFDGFIFNHNEVILYKWVEEYEPELFVRIQRLVKQGKWHIMGGWYVQPDCNMPSGESFVRQILLGRRYFQQKFGVEPTTAINFDPFGHSRGLVQIMRKSNYDSYIFCRPVPDDCPLPSDDFTWVGYDGSEVTGHRANEFYNSHKGKAHIKVENWIKEHRNASIGLILWGVGNHGGGPSRVDLDNLRDLMRQAGDVEMMHSTPEAYFRELAAGGTPHPRHEGDLNSWGVGCYTSQVRVKQKHRLLENEMYMLEKMMSNAAVQGNLAYPKNEMHEALCDLMVAEFHDILPGSSIQAVEETSLRLMDHALETISRLKARAFFSLARGQKKAEEGEIPILLYNPHPYKVKGIFECEFQLSDQNWNDEFSMPTVYQDGKPILSQAEKERSNINLDWRKRVVFAAELLPSRMNRFDCRMEVLSGKPEPQLQARGGKITFETSELRVEINCRTGLIDAYEVKGVGYLKPDAFVPFVMDDSDDSWGSQVNRFGNIAGRFTLMSAEAGTLFSGVAHGVIDSVRVIEDGPVRAVIEAVFAYGNSFLIQTYKLPYHGTEMEVHLCVHWNEKSKMLKLSIPTLLDDAAIRGQVAYGVEQFPADGRELAVQKWSAVVSGATNRAFTYINDGSYGLDFAKGELRISLVRSPAYSGYPILNRPIMPQDRYSGRMDQGERHFRFWFNAGNVRERLETVDREALAHNEKPFALSFFPAGAGETPEAFIILGDSAVQMTALKQAEHSEVYIVRLFEPTGTKRTTTMYCPCLKLQREVDLDEFEIKTFQLDVQRKTLTEVGLMERPL